MKIEEVVLLTADLKGTKHFYTEKLNLEVIKEDANSVLLKAGKTTLVFRTTSIPNPVYHFAFNISSNKIEEAADWCESKALKLLPYPPSSRIVDFPNWNAKSIYFLDNNGNILEFIARFDLPVESNLPFDEKQILNVSEIGIITDDVTQYCLETNKTLRIPFYEKQKPAPTFSVMGDAEGLLIVVSEKRTWFPTSIPSSKLPLRVVFVQSGMKYNLEIPALKTLQK